MKKGVDRTEGHDPAKVKTDLENVEATGGKVEILPPKNATRGKRGRFSPRRRQEANATQPKPEPVKTKAKAKPAIVEQEPEPTTQANKQPKNSAEYIAYASRWIEGVKDVEDARARWEGEEDMRNDLKVSVRARITLRDRISERFATP
jgi:hypothetical protein